MDILSYVVISGFLQGINAQIFSPGCPSGWILHERSCFLFAEENVVYEEADAACWASGARLTSVNVFEEHKFISDFLVSDKFAGSSYYYTSGYFYQGLLYWEAENHYHTGPSFWINDIRPKDATHLYRVAYTKTEKGYRWTNIPSSTPASYICKLPVSQTYNLEILNRDFDYGHHKTDLRAAERGPQIISQPENIIVFEGVETVELECAASGSPNPQYSWYQGSSFQNSTEVSSAADTRYTLTGGKFTIEGPQTSQDKNTYFCKAENEIGAVLSNQAKILFGYLGYVSNVEPEPLHATTFKGTIMNCETPSYSPRVTYQWFKNAANNVFVGPGNYNMFVSWSGAMYVSEVQPTDFNKRYYCLITLTSTDDAKLGRANTLVRSNKGILLLSLGDILSDNDYGPIIYTHLFPSPALKGHMVRMECFAFGSHPLQYSWRREDGRPFVKGTVISARNRVLTITNAQLEADGNYICTCTRSTGASQSKVITLAMEAKPYFPYPIKDIFADPGMTIVWNCRAVARPAPTYTWYKNGKQLRNIHDNIQLKGNVLIISNIDKARDEGMYQCAATNQHGTTFSTGQLKVLHFAPNFFRHPMAPTMMAPLEGNITIPCGVEGAPTPEIEWLKDGASLGLMRGDLTGRLGMDLRNGLVITDIRYSDQASYMCKGSNPLGEALNSTQLIVMDGIVITQPPVVQTVQVNKTAFKYCQASSGRSYDVIYIWSFNGRPIDYRLSPEFVHGQLNGVDGLYIRNAQFKHTGMYECEVRTTMQTVRRSAYLNVVGPPEAPAGLYIDDESITTRSVRLVWSMTSVMGNGGAVTSYEIEAENSFHPDEWTVVAPDVPETVSLLEAREVGGRIDQRAITVQGLIPDNNYRFRIGAANTYGRGEKTSLPTGYTKLQQTAPVFAPSNVGGGGGRVGTLTITWDILDRSEHCGPNLGYYVYWKKLDDAKDWKRATADDNIALKEGRHVVTVGTENFYLLYKVMVAAYNSNGHGPNSTEEIIYSAEGMPNSVPTQRDAKTFNATSIIVHWKPVRDNREVIRGRVAGYRIHYYPATYGDDPFTSEPDPIKSHILSKDVYGQTDHAQLIGLFPNTEYFSRVQVFNGAGFGPKGEWRRSETANDPLRDHPTFVTVHARGEHSVEVKWRGVQNYPLEESLEGYIIRVWKLQEDIRTALDTKVTDNHAVVRGLQQNQVYVLRVLGYSRAGYGRLSEAVYFAITGSQTKTLNIPIDPATSEICFSDARTCASEPLFRYSIFSSSTIVFGYFLILTTVIRVV